MPKPGFKSITVSENVYEKFYDVYHANKEELTLKGVNSFSGYVTFMLEEMMQKDKVFSRFIPRLEKISVDPDRVILKDNIQNRIAELLFVENHLECQLCNNDQCRHVGYCDSLPEVREITGKVTISTKKRERKIK